MSVMSPTTPEDLALELEVDGRAIRQWLRDEHSRTEPERWQRWHLTPEQADAVRAHFGQRVRHTERRASSMMRQAVDDRWPRA